MDLVVSGNYLHLFAFNQCFAKADISGDVCFLFRKLYQVSVIKCKSACSIRSESKTVLVDAHARRKICSVVSLRRRQSTTPGIDSLRNGSQKLVLVSRRFAEISVSFSDWLGFLHALCKLRNAKNKFLSRIEICFVIQNIKETVSDSCVYCIKFALSCYRKEGSLTVSGQQPK